MARRHYHLHHRRLLCMNDLLCLKFVNQKQARRLHHRRLIRHHHRLQLPKHQR
jgi:hypothetical protein